MKPHTKVLALAFIRYFKGMAAAVSIWLESEEKSEELNKHLPIDES